MRELIKKAVLNHSLTHDEIVLLLSEGKINQELFSAADNVRKNFVGDEVHLRALIEFSNYCRCNCMYCGIRAENKFVERYRLTGEQIISLAKNAADFGYKTVVLQSGEDMYFTAEYLYEIIKGLKENDIAVTLSIGERSFDEYKLLKDAGADRFLLRIETSDKKQYETMHPKASYENRKRCLSDLKRLGFETGTGCLVGLPNQSLSSLADDILFFKEIDADMVGIGPLIPHSHTPLKGIPSGNFILALKVMALTRLLLPDINIPATTAMETLQSDGRILALQSGANVVMPNVTLEEYKAKYEIYPNKSRVDYNELVEKLAKIGRTVSAEKGFRKKQKL